MANENQPSYILDTFGSSRIDAETIQHLYGPQIKEILLAWKNKNAEAYQALMNTTETDLRERFGFAFAKFTLIEYYNNKSNPYFITLDVVEPQDQATRMPFITRPTVTHDDPGHLFKQLDTYFAIGEELDRQGQLDVKDFNDLSTKAFHIIYGHHHHLLKPFGTIFKEGVAPHVDELIEIFLSDSDENRRANAAFLLAYMDDGQKLVEILSQRLDDTSSLVRNNALRVMVVIAQCHPEIELPMHKVLEALHYPETTDRNKAAGVMYMIAQKPASLAKYRSVLNQAVPVLLKMLALKQPNNHDLAYYILKILAGQDFGEHNLAAWETWYRQR